ncbi:MAG: MATE family efflux transporter [Rhodospirillaceae bacterium]|nr:MATE family efflux transporter [Rhodospirillaceae bacterium]
MTEAEAIDPVGGSTAAPEPANPQKNPSLTEGPVRPQLLKLTAFMALGIVASLITTLADTYFVSRLGTHELAAMTFTFPVVLLIISIAIGFGTGVVSVISRTVGEGDQAGVRALGTDSIVLATLLTACISTIGFFTIDPLFKLLGAEPEVLPLIHKYMSIWYLGTVFQIIPQIGSSVMRAHGDARTPSMLMTCTAVVNAVLDPILIFGWGPIPAMGIAGAAWAGNISRLFFIAAAAYVIQRGMHALAPLSFNMARLKASWGKLLHIALPATATQLVQPLASGILTAIIASFGTSAVAAYGIASRVEIFAFIYVMAISIALAPIVGQNAGAQKFDRVKEAVAFSIKFCLVGGVILAVLLALVGSRLASVFATDPDVIELATFYFYVVPISYAIGGIVAVAMSTLNAMALPFAASMVGLARSLFISVPFVFIGLWLGGIHGVFMAISAAAVAVGLFSWWFVHRAVYKRDHDALPVAVAAE